MHNKMQFFDSHCHFDFADFDFDRENVWRECNVVGVQSLVIPGVASNQWATAANIAQQHNTVYFGVGLHPWWVEKEFNNADIEQGLAILHQQLRENIQKSKCVAIGECGLDAVVTTPLSLQQQVLDVHLQLAQQTSLPLIIHCRKAHNELLLQLKKYQLPAGGVIHGFSGSYDMAAQYWAMGFHLGIGGTITYERANKTRQAAKQLPIESILLETDAPDMPLHGKQGERNSPVNIVAVAQTLANLRGETLEHIAAQTTRNARQLFKIIP
jgi:TatD DNase family protein